MVHLCEACPWVPRVPRRGMFWSTPDLNHSKSIYPTLAVELLFLFMCFLFSRNTLEPGCTRCGFSFSDLDAQGGATWHLELPSEQPGTHASDPMIQCLVLRHLLA